MKRIIAIGCVIIFFALLFSTAASAAQTVPVDVTVSIEHGGTAVITPQVNCPVPAVCELHLADGEVGAFHIDIDEEGEFRYTVTQTPGDRDIIYDTSVYTVCVYTEKTDGELSAVIVVYNEDDEKVSRRQSSHLWDISDTGEVVFVNSLTSVLPTSPTEITEDPSDAAGATEYPTKTSDPTESTYTADGASSAVSQPSPSASAGSSASGSGSPQTGDDSKMQQYFLLAIAAAAGLFILSLIYTHNTNQMIRK